MGAGGKKKLQAEALLTPWQGETRAGIPPTAGSAQVPVRVLAAALVLLMAACSPTTKSGTASGTKENEVPAPAFPIQTDSTHYVLQPDPFGHVTTIIATFTAPKDTTVHIIHCNGAISWGLQRLEDGHWVDAWVATTNGCLSPPFVVTAGGVRTDTLGLISRSDVPLTGSIQHHVGPGTYRVVWYNVVTSFDLEARHFGPELSLEHRVSGPITIEVAAAEAR